MFFTVVFSPGIGIAIPFLEHNTRWVIDTDLDSHSMCCLYSRLFHTHFYITVLTNLNATPHSTFSSPEVEYIWNTLLCCVCLRQNMTQSVQSHSSTTLGGEYIFYV